MRRRLAYLASFWLLTILIFILAKVTFMLCYAGSESFSAADVLSVVGHGFSLDFSTSLYVLAVPFLLVMVSVWWCVPRWVRYCYDAIIALALSLTFVADTSLYEFWRFKLDASCLAYLETPAEAMASVTTGYLVLRLIVFLLVATLTFFLYTRCDKMLTCKRLPFPLKSSEWWVRKTMETVVYIALIPLIVIGIRGGLGESTTNIGQAYFSQNQFLNHSAVNPVFSFLSSLGKSGSYIETYDYLSDEECHQLTDGLYSTETVEPDTLLRQQRPNIVLIVLESCGGQFTAIGGHEEITPTLNRLMQESVFFSECYANSWRTDKGMVSILSGYPAFPATSVMKIPEKSRKMSSIAGSLKKEGYRTAFYYGGDINFTNMRSYVMGTGYDQLKWKADYSSADQTSSQWGVRDDLMLASLLSDIKAEGDGPWMKTLLTLSSHEPWDVPEKVLDDEVYNAFHYTDKCVGAFLDSLRQLPVWDNTLVILLPDHGYRYRGIDESTRLYNHIPLIWTGGAVVGQRRIDKLCNQSDLAATLLGQMGIAHDAFTFSRDVVSRNYTVPFAYHTSTSCLSLCDSTGWMAYDLDASMMIASEGEQAESLLQRARALLQLTSQDLSAK